MSTRIILRHLTGSKANQIEQFPLDGTTAISFGRDPDCNVIYDPQRDDLVSRKHASLAVTGGERPKFVLTDLASRNGTFVNGARLTADRELAPDDVVEFGSGGPKFSFDVQPRPPNLMAQTRVMQAPQASPATRVVTVDALATAQTPRPTQEAPKSGVGRETVQRMLGEERKATSRTWMYVLAGVLLVVGAGGGALYYRMTVANQQRAAELARAKTDMAASLKQQADDATKRAGLSPEDIVHQFGNATVQIFLEWRAIDKDTGKPVYHKMLSIKGVGLVPCYVHLPDGSIVRWLTSEDDDHSNRLVGGAGSGSGFVISPTGFIITNKHVAAGWRIPYLNYSSEYETGKGLLFQMNDVKARPDIVDLTQSDEGRKAMAWVPQDDGAVMFDPHAPVALAARKNLITGENLDLSVRFPGNPSPIQAKLVSAAEDADAAEIKIDTGQALTTVQMAQDDNVRVGERVTVLGFPAFSSETHALRMSVEGGQVHQYNDVVPEPTVTEGVISLLSPPPKQINGVTLAGDMGDAYQLTVPTSHGNSGGPVFDAQGKVIALFTYGQNGRETTTYAVPIRYARDLLQMQRSN